MLIGNLAAMNAYMNKVTSEIFSFFDTGGEPERFYHGFVLGLIVELADKYVITLNRICFLREKGADRQSINGHPSG